MPPDNQTQTLTEGQRRPVDLDAEGFGPKVYTHRKQKKQDGSPVVMRLKVLDPNKGQVPWLGRTHILKSQEHFWEGTEAEFREHFDPAESEEKAQLEEDNAVAFKAEEERQKLAAQASSDEATASTAAANDRVRKAQEAAEKAKQAKAGGAFDDASAPEKKD